ncbi:MAG: TolC family protein [Planctomycetota bacterium]|nr:TolC family protein [Planctomycetota bacterium]
MNRARATRSWSLVVEPDASSGRVCALLSAVVLFGTLLTISSCASRDHAIANLEGNSIRAEKIAEVERFRSEQLIDPSDPSITRETADSAIEVPEILDLNSAIIIATKYSRSFQSQRESLFLSALSLGLTRRDFLRPVFDSSASFNASNGSGQEYQDVTALSLGGSQLLFTGGTISVNANSSLATSEDPAAAIQSSNASYSVSVNQPLLRGAGHDIAFESLTQAERSLLYQARSFELFRQDFVIQITDKYFSLISQQKKLVNTRENIEGQRFAWEQAKALFRLGRGNSLDVFRAEQALLEAQNSGIDSEQAFHLAIDQFKVDLGLPIDVEFVLQDNFPEVTPFEMNLDGAVEAALHNRLDLRTTRDQLEDAERDLSIATNSLLPSLDLSLGYSSAAEEKFRFSDLTLNDEVDYSVGLVMEIPLDRKSRRISFRSAEISLDQARRDLDRQQDEVILEVRDSLRTLQQRKVQIELGEKKILSVTFSVEKAEIDQIRGTGTNRDVVEATNSLTDAKNDQLDRIVAHEIQLLRLHKQVGLLFVDEDGMVAK